MFYSLLSALQTLFHVNLLPALESNKAQIGFPKVEKGSPRQGTVWDTPSGRGFASPHLAWNASGNLEVGEATTAEGNVRLCLIFFLLCRHQWLGHGSFPSKTAGIGRGEESWKEHGAGSRKVLACWVQDFLSKEHQSCCFRPSTHRKGQLRSPCTEEMTRRPFVLRDHHHGALRRNRPFWSLWDCAPVTTDFEKALQRRVQKSPAAWGTAGNTHPSL